MVAIAAATYLVFLPGSAIAADVVPAHGMEKVAPFEFHGDVRGLRLLPAATPPRVPSIRPLRMPLRWMKPDVSLSEPDTISPALAPMPSPAQSFPGLSFLDSCTGGQCGAGWPPDTNGDVGVNHYIQAVNDAYAIYSKTGTLLAAFTEDQLWSSGGSNPCNGNSAGDPIVLYDQLADRWILTHFAFAIDDLGDPVSPFYQCIAASKTGDPVAGGWWLYALRMDPGGTGKPPVGALNDYPKFGIWPDCLYMAANEFQAPSFALIGTAFASFSRADLYSGAPLTWALGFIDNATGPFTMIPSNLLGTSAASLPPPATPNYFVSESTTAWAFEVRKFTAGSNCGAGGTLSAATIVSQTSYPFPLASIPQPGTSNTLDSIDDRLMQKVQYRKVGLAESLWVVHNVQTASTVSLQWAQLDVTGGGIRTTPVQQQIYAPDTTLHRWMGSLAVDGQGNMALGYSTSNGSSPNFPSIAYSGRLATDPLNTLSQSEVQLVAGAGSQTNNCGGPCTRWGDYTAMSIDPADDCTFWYTNEYYSSAANGASGNWQTRIGAFKFPSCGGTAPAATTNPASGVGPTTATLNGTVNPNGAATTVVFQWGTTTSYGNTTPTQAIGGGASNVAVMANLTGLTANTTYHYRVAATNSAGTTNGADGTFTTPPRWTVSLSASNTIVPVGTLVTLTAIANDDVGPTPYWILIVDGGTVIQVCGFGTTCLASVSSSTATTKTYVAKVATLNGTNVQATSPSVSVTWGGGAPTIVAAVLPLSRSVQVGGPPATAFAVMINAGTAAATNCRPAPPASPPANLGTFSYQTTTVANVLTGTPNTPADIAPGAFQNYVFGFTPSGPLPVTSLAMRFLCDNTAPAVQTPGVNNFFLVADVAAVPDTIALMSTISGDGVVRIPGSAALELFAIATSNVGATGTIVVSGDTGGVAQPLALTVCETDLAGNCLANPAPTVIVNYQAGTNRSFKFFAQASGPMAFDPANNRVFARLTQSGVLRGATSAAVCTKPNAGC